MMVLDLSESPIVHIRLTLSVLAIPHGRLWPEISVSNHLLFLSVLIIIASWLKRGGGFLKQVHRAWGLTLDRINSATSDRNLRCALGRIGEEMRKTYGVGFRQCET